MGGRSKGGDAFVDSSIVFATVGLAAKWYATEGGEFLRHYDGVFCDEVGSIESDGQYALLWEVLRCESQQRWFLIVGVSATISFTMAQELRKIDAAWVCCRERRFPLERNLLQVSSLQLFYDAIVHIACALLRRGSSCLVFLPGKQEIHPCIPASNIAS